MTDFIKMSSAWMRFIWWNQLQTFNAKFADGHMTLKLQLCCLRADNSGCHLHDSFIQTYCSDCSSILLITQRKVNALMFQCRQMPICGQNETTITVSGKLSIFGWITHNLWVFNAGRLQRSLRVVATWTPKCVCVSVMLLSSNHNDFSFVLEM